MRIAHVLNTLRVGGAEKLVITFAGEMRRRGMELTILTLRPSNPLFMAEAEAQGAKIVQFPKREILAPGRFRQLLRFLQQERFDVLHTHLTTANIIGISAGTMARIPVVTSLHNTVMRTENMPIHRTVETLLLRYAAAAVVAVGWQTAAAHQPRLGKRPLLVIPNAVPCPPPLSREEKDTLRRELAVDPQSPLLIYVGRIVPQKAVSDLVQAFAQLTASFPQARLALVGAGPLEMEVQAQIEALGLGERVHMLGQRSDVTRLLGAADLFVSAAHWEGLPVASLEAMAAGLPVVATRVGDLPRVVIEGTGLLTPPKQPEALAEAMAVLLKNPSIRAQYGVAARRRIETEFSAQAWADKLLQLYAEVAGGKYKNGRGHGR